LSCSILSLGRPGLGRFLDESSIDERPPFVDKVFYLIGVAVSAETQLGEILELRIGDLLKRSGAERREEFLDCAVVLVAFPLFPIAALSVPVVWSPVAAIDSAALDLALVSVSGDGEELVGIPENHVETVAAAACVMVDRLCASLESAKSRLYQLQSPSG